MTARIQILFVSVQSTLCVDIPRRKALKRRKTVSKTNITEYKNNKGYNKITPKYRVNI